MNDFSTNSFKTASQPHKKEEISITPEILYFKISSILSIISFPNSQWNFIVDDNPPTTLPDFVGAPADKRRSSTLINADRKLYALLRLRIPSQFFERKKHFIKILDGAAIIREIQTFGEVVPIGEKKIAPQHRGLGKKLIKEAEKIVKNELGLKKMAVISGIGTRGYFQKFGYKLRETYMVKEL